MSKPHFLLFLIMSISLSCGSSERKDNRNNSSFTIKFIVEKRTPIKELIESFDFHDKHVYEKYGTTEELALIEATNQSEDTIFLHLYMQMYAANQSFFKLNNDGSLKYLGYNGGGGGINTFPLRPHESKRFVSPIGDPIMWEADVIKFSFPFSLLDTINYKSTLRLDVFSKYDNGSLILMDDQDIHFEKNNNN